MKVILDQILLSDYTYPNIIKSEDQKRAVQICILSDLNINNSDLEFDTMQNTSMSQDESYGNNHTTDIPVDDDEEDVSDDHLMEDNDDQNNNHHNDDENNDTPGHVLSEDKIEVIFITW